MKKVFFLQKDYMYEYEDGKVVKRDLKKEKGIYTSIIHFKDIFDYTFKLPVDIPEEELIAKADETVFKETTLDLTKSYKINYYFYKLDIYYIVEAFIVEEDKLVRLFAPLIEKFKYIDFISATPFVFESFYDIQNIEPKNDLFIYFTPEDSFIAGFSNKKFVFVKTLDKFSQLIMETSLKEENLIKILEEYGLQKELYSNTNLYEKISSFFSQFFVKVNNLINYSKNFYNLQSIDRIFFYSNIDIHFLIENYQDFWKLSGVEFLKFKIDGIKYDPFEYCATIFNAKHYLDDKLNFSIFLRPPPFYKTEIGKFTIFSILISLIILGDAGYKYMIINNQEKKIAKLEYLLKQKHKKYKMVKLSIKKYKQKVKDEIQIISSIESQIDDIASKIDYLYSIKVNKSLYNKLADIINYLNKNDLEFLNLEKDKNKYKLLVVSKSKNSKLIADFLNYLIHLGYKEISSKKIINQKNRYISEIRYAE